MKVKNLLIILIVMLVLSSTPVFASEAMVSTAVGFNQEMAVVDGQAVIITKTGVQKIEADGIMKMSASIEGSEIKINGQRVATISSGLGSDYVMPRQGYVRSLSPIYGVSTDYTDIQGFTYRNIALEKAIISTGISALSMIISVTILPATVVAIDVALILAGKYVEIYPQTKTLYLKERTFGHKIMPGIYHNIYQYWCTDSTYNSYLTPVPDYFDGWV